MANITECDIILSDERRDMEDKIWQIFLAVLTAILTASAEELRERFKEKKPKD